MDRSTGSWVSLSEIPRDDAAEQAVIGAAVMVESLLPAIVGPEGGLRAEHFYVSDHGHIFNAMLRLLDRGDPIDEITLRTEAKEIGGFDRDPAALIASCIAGTPAPHRWQTYAKTVKEKAYLRDVLKAGELLKAAALTGDRTKLAEAERLVEAGQVDSSPLYTPERQAQDFIDRKLAPVICPWPWPRLNELSGGGLRAAQATVLAGRTNFGKSPAADQILLEGRTHGLRTALYINEMGVQERAQRFAAQLRGGQVTFEQIRDDRLSDVERDRTAKALADFSVPIRDISGWDAESVCRDIARCGWQLVGVDILHNFAYMDQDRDLARMMGAFKACAQRTGCHIIVVAHLNKGSGGGSFDGEDNSPPKLRDLRGSGMIANLADFVVFVHRETNAAGKPLPPGDIWIAKGRNSQLGGLHAKYDHEAMRWEQVGG